MEGAVGVPPHVTSRSHVTAPEDGTSGLRRSSDGSASSVPRVNRSGSGQVGQKVSIPFVSVGLGRL